jgi:type IV secretory pathway TrbF-like protein
MTCRWNDVCNLSAQIDCFEKTAGKSMICGGVAKSHMAGRIIKQILAALLLLGSIAAAQAQSIQVPRLRAQLDSLEMRYRSASAASEVLSRQADSLAAVIKKRKSARAVNLLKDRALAEELQRSQTLANNLQTARQLQAVQLDSLIQKAEQTLKILNDEVTQLTLKFSAAKLEGNRDLQNRLATDLREVESLRQRCQTLLQNAPAPAPVIEVRANPDDSPEVLAQKADFLLDQSDRLRRSAAQAERKSKQVRQELTVRERLSDFVQDLRVFDPATETPRTANESATLTLDPGTDFNATPERVGFPAGAAQLILVNEQFWPQDIGQLSNADLKRWISRLELQQRQWLMQADSLAQRSKELRKSISR